MSQVNIIIDVFEGTKINVSVLSKNTHINLAVNVRCSLCGQNDHDSQTCLPPPLERTTPKYGVDEEEEEDEEWNF